MTQHEMTGGEAAVESLRRWAVDTVFGLPGVQLDQLFDALHRRGEGIRVIHTRHEQGAAYMALGAAASTGRPAVFAVVPGPGVLNAGAALATAYACGARVLCLTSTVATAQIGRGNGALHEIPDQTGYLRGLTKWYGRAGSAAEVPAVLDEAFRQLMSGRPRPVAVEIPPDVLAQRAVFPVAARPVLPARPLIADSDIEVAAVLLMAARKPMIVVGSGARQAGPALTRLAERLQAPVVSRTQGRGIVSDRSDHAWSAAMANDEWADVDVVLALGTRLTQLREWGSDAALSVIRVDIDHPEIVRNGPPRLGVVADAADFTGRLLAHLEAQDFHAPSRLDWLRRVRRDFRALTETTIQPQIDYLDAIRAVLPDSGILVDEMTQVGYVARYGFGVHHPTGFISSSYQGTLGFGFATAIGVQAANPDRRVVSITGDGGFLFTMPELSVLAQQQIPLTTVVFADGHFGNVRRIQDRSYGGRFIASTLHNPDFLTLARSFGIRGLTAEGPAGLKAALATAFEGAGPSLIVVPVRIEDMASPWPHVHGRKVR